MTIEGFIEYKRREFCNDIPCSAQVELNKLQFGSKKYEKVRMTCKTACRYTTYEFHHWLLEKGYLIVRPKEGGGK